MTNKMTNNEATIKVEDLRVGNLVYSGINSNEIIKVYPMFLVQFSKIQEEEHNIKPIPLAEEWLLKLGFTGRLSDHWHVLNIKDLAVYFNGETLQIENHGEHGGLIYRQKGDNYVHTLQNLVKALTNTELIIKK